MCKALEELEEKGRIEGRREGEIKGEIKNKILLIQKKSQRKGRGQTFRGIGKVTAGRGQNRMCPCRGMWRMYLSDTSIRQAA